MCICICIHACMYVYTCICKHIASSLSHGKIRAIIKGTL